MRPNGSRKRRVTGDAFGVSPTFSPDGRRIVFVGDRHRDLFSVRRNGSDLRLLTNNRRSLEFSPAFSPDGTKVAFARVGRKRNRIFVITADGSRVRKIRGVSVGWGRLDWGPRPKRRR
jgi:TolB protein